MPDDLRREVSAHLARCAACQALTADLARLVSEEARSGDVVVLLGAGDITGWAYALPDQLSALAKAAE